MEHKSPITPKTKVLDLITDYPELEEVLFDISPAFRQLKNPILRRTVARVTTLQQAAIVGNMKVEDLVNKLRKETGMSEYEKVSHASRADEISTGVQDKIDETKISQRLDAREMLNRGEHPVGQVLADLSHLPEGAIYELTAPFHPAPLIDKARGIGFSHYIKVINPEEYRIYFWRGTK